MKFSHGTTLLIAIAGASVAVILAGCGASGPPSTSADAASPHPGVVTFARASSSNGWEGDKCIDTSIILNPAVYDTLLRIEVPGGKSVTPGLASDYEWDDASNAYVLHLREDAMFSNGDPVTADDVAFSVNEWISGDFSGSYYTNVSHPEVVDEHTVKIVMKQVDSFLPALLTWCTSTIYPADFAGMSRDEYFQKPIGAGPYAVQSWTDPMGTSEKITFVPNEFFYGWEGEAPLDSFVVETVTDPNQRALEFQAGSVDILESVDAATATQMSQDELVTTEPSRIEALLLNMETPGLDNPAIREAISLGIDREALALTLANGSVAAEGALPINVPGEVAPTEPNSYDPERAKQLIADSGETDLTFELLYNSADYSNEITAQTIQAQLAEIGITLDFVATDGNTQFARFGDGEYEIGMTSPSAISPSIFDPLAWIAVQYGWTGSATTVLQDGFVAGTATLDAASQDAHVRTMHDFLMTDRGMIGMFNSPATFAVQSWVEGFDPLQYRSFYFDTIAD